MQSHIWLTASSYGEKFGAFPHILGSPSSYIWLCTRSHRNFLIYEENFVSFFISVRVYPAPTFLWLSLFWRSPHLSRCQYPPQGATNMQPITCNGNHHDWFAKIILASGRASATKQPDFRLPEAVPPKHSRVFRLPGGGECLRGVGTWTKYP